MKKFIKTEEVQATEAILKGGNIYLPTDAISKTMEPRVEGYKVVDSNGCVSFIPKAEFEKRYKCVETV